MERLIWPALIATGLVMAWMIVYPAFGPPKPPPVTYEFYVDWGHFFSDDVCVTNTSSFTLTGVVFQAHVRSTGNYDWSERFTTERIDPGETHRWKTWITSRGKDAACTGRLWCGQSRDWVVGVASHGR